MYPHNLSLADVYCNLSALPVCGSSWDVVNMLCMATMAFRIVQIEHTGALNQTNRTRSVSVVDGAWES
jgi:hypothetical protein